MSPLPLRERIRGARRDWSLGRYYGYPLCCVAHYCWDSLIGWPASTIRADEVNTDPAGEFRCVPCGIFHACGSPYSLRERIRRIARFNWWYLQPGTHGRTYRTMVQGFNHRWTSSDERCVAELGELHQCHFGGRELDPDLDWS